MITAVPAITGLVGRALEIKKELSTPTPVRRYRRIRTEKRFGFTRYGYTADGQPVPDEYLIKITSIRNRCTIVAPLQEGINMQVESRWDPFIPTELLVRGNIFTQAITGVLGMERRALVTRATSRRIWMGSTPLTLSFTLKFEAVKDPYQEVVLPGRMLQAMALPSDPSLEVASSQEMKEAAKKGFWKTIESMALKPPGPNPFSLDDILTGRKSFPEMNASEVMDSTKGGDFIMVEVGRFLTFFNVIVKESRVTYKTKFARGGDPVEAEANVIFETYEMMTTESLADAYDKYTAVKGFQTPFGEKVSK